jgi:hypothetical protein
VTVRLLNYGPRVEVSIARPSERPRPAKENARRFAMLMAPHCSCAASNSYANTPTGLRGIVRGNRSSRWIGTRKYKN